MKNNVNTFLQGQNNNSMLYQLMLYIEIDHSIMPMLLTSHYLFYFKSSQKNKYFSIQYVNFQFYLYFFITLMVICQFLIIYLIAFENVLE